MPIRCSFGPACLGGLGDAVSVLSDGARDTQHCAEGYTGRTCARCIEDYYTFDVNKCRPCSSGGMVLGIVFILGCAAALVFSSTEMSGARLFKMCFAVPHCPVAVLCALMSEIWGVVFFQYVHAVCLQACHWNVFSAEFAAACRRGQKGKHYNSLRQESAAALFNLIKSAFNAQLHTHIP